MKWSKKLWVLMAAAALAVAAGCSGGSNPVTPPGGQTAHTTITMTDTPPAGITVLSFEVTVTGATLNPASGTPVTLVSSSNPIQIEIKHLEVESAFLKALNIPADTTFNSITISFANPELTFKNDTAATQLGCAAGAVCEVKPSVAGSVTFSGSPFPLSLTAGTSTGFQIDVNLNNLLTDTSGQLGVDFNATNVLTVTQLPVQAGGELDELEDLSGIVANLDAGNKKFQLQTTDGNFDVTWDSNTKFEDFNEDGGCAANDATCLANGQAVEVDLAVMSGGGFLAKKVELQDRVVDDEIEGFVFSVESTTQFKMAVTDELKAFNGISVGNPIVVNLDPSVSFKVDTDGLTVPSTQLAAFNGATDTSQLIPGQVVEVRVKPGSFAAGPPITITATRVRLKMTHFTANVAGAPAPPNFNLGSLPGLFTSAGITQIQVQTSSVTEFEKVTGVSGLADGDTVSVKGLLFSATPNPILIAKKVRKRL